MIQFPRSGSPPCPPTTAEVQPSQVFGRSTCVDPVKEGEGAEQYTEHICAEVNSSLCWLAVKSTVPAFTPRNKPQRPPAAGLFPGKLLLAKINACTQEHIDKAVAAALGDRSKEKSVTMPTSKEHRQIGHSGRILLAEAEFELKERKTGRLKCQLDQEEEANKHKEGLQMKVSKGWVKSGILSDSDLSMKLHFLASPLWLGVPCAVPEVLAPPRSLLTSVHKQLVKTNLWYSGLRWDHQRPSRIYTKPRHQEATQLLTWLGLDWEQELELEKLAGLADLPLGPDEPSSPMLIPINLVNIYTAFAQNHGNTQINLDQPTPPSNFNAPSEKLWKDILAGEAKIV
ncbi:hypothetical protein BDK51DRAFT_49155 [Blyttiomyces helicus]|uniref:Uncharacterized protein n=1 Tax=Blyttiomyces helicus TaxID=388810 RepID=A0A4P9WPZ9_9FUNG|nr:hypothetical protein BDK51DRAFT_49155 [Blyttiomyces helicus]|eukprot:RKO93848.1 hypothetical protein BDK51DRAFT_49155 [Blyttiomyces helicus]